MLNQSNVKQARKILAAGLTGAAAALAVGLPQAAQAQSLSYGYAYQDIRNLRINGLENNTTLRFQPFSSAGSSILGLGGDGQSNPFDTPESYTGPNGIGANLGAGNNTTFFNNNPFDSQIRGTGQGNPDFARGDAAILVRNDVTGAIRPVASDTELTNLLLRGVQGQTLLLGNVAESYLTSPTSTTCNTNTTPPTVACDQGTARGRYNFVSDNLTVSADTPISFDFQYLTGLQTDLVGAGTSPLQNLAASVYGIDIQIYEIDANGNQVNPPVYSYNVSPNQGNCGGDGCKFGLTNISEAVGGDVFEIPLDQSLLSYTLEAGKTYSIRLFPEEQVDTRITEDLAVEVPEPTSTAALLGFASLGLLLKRKQKEASY
jgi:hypothetical protein